MPQRRQPSRSLPEAESVLRVTRSQIEDEIDQRLGLGQQLLDRNISTVEGVDALRREFRTWDEYNEQLLERRFSTARVSREYELVGFGFGGRATPQQELDGVHRDLRAQMRKLESIREQLELYPSEVGEAEQGTSRAARTQSGADGRIFIGHGGSPTWRVLKDFLSERLGLDWEEFNRVSPAGIGTSARLQSMLDNASMAFLVLTAEDEHADGSEHPRENVIHEAGLFQGRLGFPRAIVLLEDGCAEFSNISGLGQIRFRPDHIEGSFEEVRRVLEREGLIAPVSS
jgi:predicted nucleotide-binding protein